MPGNKTGQNQYLENTSCNMLFTCPPILRQHHGQHSWAMKTTPIKSRIHRKRLWEMSFSQGRRRDEGIYPQEEHAVFPTLVLYRCCTALYFVGAVSAPTKTVLSQQTAGNTCAALLGSTNFGMSYGSELQKRFQVSLPWISSTNFQP